MLNKSELAYWTAGIFEVAGSAFYRKSAAGKKATIPHKYYPVFSVYDDSNRIKKLQTYLGGNIQSNKKDWRATNAPALEIAEMISDIAPLRKIIAQSFLYWAELDTVEKYLYVSRLLATVSKQTEISKAEVAVKDYESLVTEPAFMAGVIDARGSFSEMSPGEKDAHVADEVSLNISTHNIALLNAVKNVFNGSTPRRMTSEYGQGYQWAASWANLRNLMAEVQPYMLLRDVEYYVKKLEKTKRNKPNN
ncbi:MAG: hypothetical protein ABFQ62_02320 [Patescibacteria group bacterium]